MILSRTRMSVLAIAALAAGSVAMALTVTHGGSKQAWNRPMGWSKCYGTVIAQPCGGDGRVKRSDGQWGHYYWWIDWNGKMDTATGAVWECVSNCAPVTVNLAGATQTSSVTLGDRN